MKNHMKRVTLALILCAAILLSAVPISLAEQLEPVPAQTEGQNVDSVTDETTTEPTEATTIPTEAEEASDATEAPEEEAEQSVKRAIAPYAATSTVTVTVEWIDGGAVDLRPGSVKAQLWAYVAEYDFETPFGDATLGIDEEVYLTAAGGWTYTWTNLPSKSGFLDITSYSVKISPESLEVENYERASITGVGSSWTIKYTLDPTIEPEPDPEPQTGGLTVSKTVTGTAGETDKAFSFRVSLSDTSINGTYDDMSFTEGAAFFTLKHGESKTATGLPEGVTYTVTESGNEGYTVTKTGDTGKIEADQTAEATFTNHKDAMPEPETTDITVKIVWNDGGNADKLRPESVLVELSQGFNTLKTEYAKEDNDWTVIWTDLPIPASNRPYSVSGDWLDGYTITSSRVEDETGTTYTLTYTHTPSTPSTTQAAVEIIWNDNDDADGMRPDSIEVTLLQNCKDLDISAPYGVTATITPNGDGKWIYTWTDLPEYEGKYKLTYTAVASGYSEHGYGTPDIVSVGNDTTITYTYDPSTIPLTMASVEIVWDDYDDAAGLRPPAVTVALLRDGKTFRTVDVTAEAGWKYTWENLPKMNRAGDAESTYTVALVGGSHGDYVPGYRTPVNSWDTDHWVITNKVSPNYEPRRTDVSVRIEWVGDDESTRPGTVDVTLYADGNPMETVTLSASNGWTHTWPDQLEWSGHTIDYKVEQSKQSGYVMVSNTTKTGSVVGSNGKVNVVITNTAVEETSVTVHIEWADLDDTAASSRPAEVTVKLYRGTGKDSEIPGKLENEVELLGSDVTLSEENNWTYTWTELPRYALGSNAEFFYSVREMVPDGYSVDLIENEDGSFTLRNHSCYTSYITIAKTWDDTDDWDGLRPDSISVDVYKRHLNDEEYTDWTYVTTVELTAQTDWEPVVIEVEYAPDIEFMVVENPVPDGYTAKIVTSGELPEGTYRFDITNAHTPELPATSLTVEKKWAGDSNADQPDAVTVQLYRDGTAYGEPVKLNAANNWRYTWNGLNSRYTWTADEVEVPEGYEKSVTHNGTAWTITNTWTVEETEPEQTTLPPSADIPKTGDNSHFHLWVTLMVLSAVGIIVLLWKELPEQMRKRER